MKSNVHCRGWRYVTFFVLWGPNRAAPHILDFGSEWTLASFGVYLNRYWLPFGFSGRICLSLFPFRSKLLREYYSKRFGWKLWRHIVRHSSPAKYKAGIAK